MSAAYPPITIHTCEAARREPGYIILPIGKDMRVIRRDSEFEALLALDVSGAIAWEWHSPGPMVGDVRRTARNTLLMLSSEGCVMEIDFSGKTLATWSTQGRNPKYAAGAIPVATPLFHHAVRELPNGNIAALSIAQKNFDDVPLSEDDIHGPRGKRSYVADTLVEFKRDGTIVREHNFFDILDPERIGYGHDSPFWKIMNIRDDGADWTHSNGFDYDASDDSYIVTVRHQDCVIKIDRQSGKLKWILGTHEQWRGPWTEKLLHPGPQTTLHWHPHDPSFRKDGSILIFDNGEVGAFPPSPKPDVDQLISRAVAYKVDEKAGTFQQVWSFGSPEQKTPFSIYIGGAQEMPKTGNVFITFGGIVLKRPDNARTDFPLDGHGSVELYEVTGGPNPEIVFHAEINNRNTDEDKAWAAFRCEWVPSIA